MGRVCLRCPVRPDKSLMLLLQQLLLEVTICSAKCSLPEPAWGVIPSSGASGTRLPQVKPRGLNVAASIEVAGKVAWAFRANASEPPSRVVIKVEPKMLIGSGQKARDQDGCRGQQPSQTLHPRRKRWSPACSGALTKQGKPVTLPPGKPAVRLAHGVAGKGCPRKRMPGCNGRDSGVVPRRESVLTSDGSQITITNGEAIR